MSSTVLMKWLAPRIRFPPSGISNRTELSCTPIIVSVQPHDGLISDDALLGHLSRSPHGRSSFKNLVRELGVKGEARQQVGEALQRLVERGDLIALRGGQYAVSRLSREFLPGRLQMHKDGYGFV